MSELKTSLDIIRKESNNLITAIDERFNIICKERGINFTIKETESKESQNDAHDIIMPDPSIGFSEMSLYGYTDESMFPLTVNYAIDLFNQDFTIYLLFNDNTESMVYDSSEINNHDGIFGVERDDWLNSKQYMELSAENNETVKESKTDDSVTPTLETIPKEVPIYKYSGEYAAQNGEIDVFRASYKVNIECGQAIDRAITDSNYEQYRYDLKTAAKTVINEFGVDRAAWVLSGNINYHHWDGQLSNANKAWAKEFDTSKPDIYLKTHLAVLDGFADRFREIVKEKPSLIDTLNKNEQKSKTQFSQTPDIGKEKPKIKKDGEML